MRPIPFKLILTAFFIAAVSVIAFGQGNPDSAYVALRNVRIGNDAVSVGSLVLKRDAAVFTFTSGTMCFLAPVEGKITGAVFSGAGTFALTPPSAIEKASLSRLTKEPRILEDFDHLVLRFTDGTYDEVRKSAQGQPGSAGGCNAGQFSEIQNALRTTMKWNLSARILQDVYSDQPGSLFVAFIRGKKYDDKLVYAVDPHGTPLFEIGTSAAPARGFGNVMPMRIMPAGVSADQVELITWDENKQGVWTGFVLHAQNSGAATSTKRQRIYEIDRQQLDTTLEKGGRLGGRATTTITAVESNLRVIPFDLYPSLRVQKVSDSSGTPLNFIQEAKEEDAQFSVVLPKPLKTGDQYTIVTDYEGKDAVSNLSGGNYYLMPGARESWYPNNPIENGFSNYEMRFTYPKEFKLVASGTPGKESNEGNQIISEWRSDHPQPDAAFNFGKFKKDEKVGKGFTLEAYANKDLPDFLAELQSEGTVVDNHMHGSMFGSGTEPTTSTLGTISTTSMAQRALSEAEIATQIYTDYFGVPAVNRVAMTQQPADNYGQSWPGLVWLPISYFLDDTNRHRFYNFDPRGYFKVVAPHEIAHQWWGTTVTWDSYRDQWMSEGFSDASAAIFLQLTNKKPDAFIKFWNDERDFLLYKNAQGFRPNDVGPVTLGERLDNSKVGEDVYEHVVYSKGAYILHMLRMLMWDSKSQDHDKSFKAMMHDFLDTYRGKAASTEDFKSMVEKHMIPQMDLAGDHRMDWFFDEYVYGTKLPAYTFDYTFDGLVLNLKLAQSNVDNSFRMAVPLYLEFSDGRVSRLGSFSVNGNATVNQKVDLAAMGLKEKPKRAMINYFNDVLCEK
ncbi:MAG: M1 family aminopeptidase [Terriglobales bacterium]|jgi:hypothetical protein